MNQLQRLASALFTLAAAACVAACAWWLITHRAESKPAEKTTSHAAMDKVVKEDDLNTISLTEAAHSRIGVSVAPLMSKKIGQVRTYAGEVTVPPGKTIAVAAPVGGTLRMPQSGELIAGQAVKAGTLIFHLTPLLSPDGRATLSASLADAEGQVNNAKTQLELARITLDRASRVLKEGAGSQRQVDEAEAAHSLASKTLDAAITRQTILKKVMGDADSGSVTSIPIVAPSDGVLRTISARKGQSVPSGALLFEILDTSIVWIKVPLPNGDLDSATSAATAEVGKLSAANLSAPVTAKKVAAPPSGNLLSSSVDVFYELANKDGKLIPGQRLGVTIPLGESKTRLFVPWSSIVIDIHGNSWVYEELSSRKYVRRRVLVEYTLGHDAVLASGPGEGAKIVMTGAMELFGAETGFVK